MSAPLTEYDIENYGYKIEDVKKINFYITAFSLAISCFVNTGRLIVDA